MTRMQLVAMRQAVTFSMAARDTMQARLEEKQYVVEEQRSIINNIEQRLERLLALTTGLNPVYSPSVPVMIDSATC